MKSRTPEEKLKDRLFNLGPKRLLAISGDGLRGVVSTGLLAELEARLSRRAGRRDGKLSDYFDIIGGAGIGGYIAGQLAIGRRVAQVTESLRGLHTSPQAAKGGARFDSAALDARIGEIFSGRVLDAASTRTGLALVAAPAGGALKVLSNTPRAGEVMAPAPPLADVVRATVAGAKIAEAREIDLGAVGLKFVDPAMGGAGDPTQLLIEAATLAPYGIGWPTGPDLLLVVSVGTASLDLAAPSSAPFLAEARRRALVSVQALAHAPEPWSVGGELGDMREARLSPVPMWHFVRLDARVDLASVGALGLEYDATSLQRLQDANPWEEASLARLHEIGLRKARAILGDERKERELFPPRFDPPSFFYRPLGPPKTRLEALGRAFARPMDPED